MHTLLKAAAAALAMGLGALSGGPAGAQERDQFQVVETDARIAFTSTIRDFERIDDDTYLIRAGANRLYLAHLPEGCGRGVFPHYTIGVETHGQTGVDRFSLLVLDSLRRCPIESLERVTRVS